MPLKFYQVSFQRATGTQETEAPRLVAARPSITITGRRRTGAQNRTPCFSVSGLPACADGGCLARNWLRRQCATAVADFPLTSRQFI